MWQNVILFNPSAQSLLAPQAWEHGCLHLWEAYVRLVILAGVESVQFWRCLFCVFGIFMGPGLQPYIWPYNEVELQSYL